MCWLVGRAEGIAERVASEAEAAAALEELCRRGREIARTVTQACQQGGGQAAILERVLANEAGHEAP